ncbi:MAG: hypothetical protein ACHQHM_04655, partial [Thermoanaerobaculales bacterium]
MEALAKSRAALQRMRDSTRAMRKDGRRFDGNRFWNHHVGDLAALAAADSGVFRRVAASVPDPSRGETNPAPLERALDLAAGG